MIDVSALANLFLASGAFVLALASLWVARTQSGGNSKLLRMLKRHEEERWKEIHQRLRHLETRPAPTEPELSSFRTDASLPGLRGRLQVLELRVSEHDSLLCSLVSEDEARHLWNMSSTKAIEYQRHAGLDDELRSLVRRGLLIKQGDFKIHHLPSSFDPKQHFTLTDTGETLLHLRRHLQVSDVRGPESLPPPLTNSEDEEERVTHDEIVAPTPGERLLN